MHARTFLRRSVCIFSTRPLDSHAIQCVSSARRNRQFAGVNETYSRAKQIRSTILHVWLYSYTANAYMYSSARLSLKTLIILHDRNLYSILQHSQVMYIITVSMIKKSYRNSSMRMPIRENLIVRKKSPSTSCTGFL